MQVDSHVIETVRNAVNEQRLLDTAISLIEVPSPTRSAAEVANRLGELLGAGGFSVERPEAGWSDAPAVAARFSSGGSGRTLQFNGHLDTVHLPFVEPKVTDGVLTGSGASDMKGGIAAAYEAMRVLRETGLMKKGEVLLTAHDLHEIPWGDGSQVDGLIDAGFVGDAVLLPEYHSTNLPIVGRGLAVLGIDISREGVPVHEVLGGKEQPSVIGAGAELVVEFEKLDEHLSQKTHELAGTESVFVGQISSGEIYNQSPTSLNLQGTRRWLPSSTVADVEAEFRRVLESVADRRGVKIEANFQVARDAFEIDQNEDFVVAFQSAYSSAVGTELPIGAKPFVDDGNTFTRRAGVPAITHGPNATGAHTLDERVPVSELVRIAETYALAALAYC